MEILKLQFDTFARIFKHEKLNGLLHPIQFVQPHDGVLSGYSAVEVDYKQTVGMDQWSQIEVIVKTTYTIRKHDDLSVVMVAVKVESIYNEIIHKR